MSPQLSPGRVPITPPGSLSPPHVGDMGAKRCRAVTTSHGQSTARHHAPHPTPPTGGPVPAPPFTLARGRTMKAPPPPDSTMMARNLGLTAQKELSHVTLETRMSSYIWSAFTGCPKTCRNLLWRTTRRLMAGGGRVRTWRPPVGHRDLNTHRSRAVRDPHPGLEGSVGMWGRRGMGARDGTRCGPHPTEGPGAAVGAGVGAGHQHAMAQCCLSALRQGRGCAVHQGCAMPYGRAVPYSCATLMAVPCPMDVLCPMAVPSPVAVPCSMPLPPPWLCHVLWLCFVLHPFHPHGCATSYVHAIPMAVPCPLAITKADPYVVTMGKQGCKELWGGGG